MSRTVPAVADGYVVTLGPKCHVRCLDAKTGRLAWKMDLVGEYGAVVPPWYAGQCPLIDGGAAIIAPGGESLMVAVELATGRIRWKTPNPDKWDMTHGSIMRMDYKGITQYLYCYTGGVAAVAATDGHVLWKKADWKIELANVPSPLVVGNDLVFFTGGYNSGCLLARLTGEAGDIKTEEVFRRPAPVFASDQQTPAFHDGHIYGVIPGGQMACLDLSGKKLWESGNTRRFGLGPYMIADGLILALNDQDGTLRLAEASSDEYRELASAKVLDGHDAWGPMALVGERLILRDSTRMVCLELPRGE
jgi:outer membrane protein assembly factor BamB